MSKTGSQTAPLTRHASTLRPDEDDEDAESGSTARTAISSLRKRGRRMVNMFLNEDVDNNIDDEHVDDG